MKIKSIPKLAISLIIPQLAGFIGSNFTTDSISSWYETLAKPEFTPPNYVFGPVWITLYFLIGVSLYLVWTSEKRKSGKLLVIFGVQMFLNAIWSIAFFGLQSPILGLAIIIPLLGSIALMIGTFWRASRPASYVLIPYIVWVSIATYLNYNIWVLN
ncbi:TspO protein [Nitrosopumilus sp. b1]|uniref:TspO/MBR family protein n=1 Tax=Nitrosopumilus sp. b1 TaxID=2109907 RepID=UPI0015F46E06|nr:TspO/MBR family protein [Nitrosopumilus sp. b1]KAF6242086.1 TspO protein [Nitrosopumilus sp. b1]